MLPITLVPASIAFPRNNNDFAEFKTILQQISRTDALATCAKINLYLSNIENLKRQGSLVKQFFRNPQQSRIFSYSKLTQRQKHPQLAVPFSRGQILELIRWICLFCHDHEDDGRSFTRSSARYLFGQAALIAGDIWNDLVYKPLKNEDGTFNITPESLIAPIRHGIEENAAPKDILRVLGRSQILVRNIFPKFFTDFEAKFLENTNISIDEYYTCILTLYGHVDMTLGTGEKFFFDTRLFQGDTHWGDVFQKFFSLKAQTVDDLKESIWGNLNDISDFNEARDYNLKPLVEKPILLLNENTGIVIDPVFFANSAINGPLFLLGATNLALSAFGDAFEAYVHYLLEKVYPDADGLVKRIYRNPHAVDNQRNSPEITDICITDTDQMMMGELKARWIPEQNVSSLNYQDFIDVLLDRYLRNGRFQLGRSIAKLATGDWTTNEIDLQVVEKIYPLLIVYDELLYSIGQGNLLNSHFVRELAPDSTYPDGQMQKGKFRVSPLVVITIDMLEELATPDLSFTLSQLIDDYISRFQNSEMSLRDYIYFFSHYINKLDTRNSPVVLAALQHVTRLRSLAEELAGEQGKTSNTS